MLKINREDRIVKLLNSMKTGKEEKRKVRQLENKSQRSPVKF